MTKKAILTVLSVLNAFHLPTNLHVRHSYPPSDYLDLNQGGMRAYIREASAVVSRDIISIINDTINQLIVIFRI